jgi:hypothetical protein
MIGALMVYDLSYMRLGVPDSDAKLRSVLIKTGADQYREIDVVVRRNYFWTGVDLDSEIVTLNGEPILIAKSHDAGNHGRIDTQLYMFQKDGWENPDFSAVALHPRN